MTTKRQVLLDGAPDNRSTRHRLSRFADWLELVQIGPREVTEETLTEYRHFLREKYALAANSVEAHISTIRARLRSLTKASDRNVQGPGQQPDLSVSKKRSRTLDKVIDEMRAAGEWPSEEAWAERRVEDLKRAELRATQTPRLDSEQVDSLLRSPGLDTRMGKRDTAVIGLLACTGIRPEELTRLEVSDLNHELNGQLALRIPQRNGSTDRLVPYAELAVWSLGTTVLWLIDAGISEGPVFRGLFKGGVKLRPGRMGVKSIEHILNRYPVMIDTFEVTITPLVLRRTYATHLYMTGREIPIIQSYLGLKSSDAVLAYIGFTDDDKANEWLAVQRSWASPVITSQDDKNSELFKQFFQGLATKTE